ncbi:unnamed protein product [Allacma fusca]|uniref:Uncharacterized protein n=1 Tax=Allacma fusca TaxID=39272 RepID=A0A8J2JMS1_9HEXA|nr:unnamed protein product [Allacma fusca]
MEQNKIVSMFLLAFVIWAAFCNVAVQSDDGQQNCPYNNGIECSKYCKSIGKLGGACNWFSCNCYPD